jgi:pilus assembly protein CpaE
MINLKKLYDYFRYFGFPKEEKIRILINRYEKKNLISPKEAEDMLNKKIFWFIPNDFAVTMSAINQGKPLCALAPEAEVSKNIQKLASTLLGRDEPKKKSGGWSKRLF